MTPITSPGRSGNWAASRYPSTLRANTSGSASYQRPIKGEGRTSGAILVIVALSSNPDNDRPRAGRINPKILQSRAQAQFVWREMQAAGDDHAQTIPRR